MLRNEHGSYLLPFFCMSILLFMLASCTPFSSSQPPASQPLAFGPPTPAIYPTCSQAESSATSESLGPVIPANTQTLVGFYPLLPTKLPGSITSDEVLLLSKNWHNGLAPLFHVEYGVWLSGGTNSYGLSYVFSLDETTASLTPFTLIHADVPLHVTGKTTTKIGTISGTTFHLTSASQQVQMSEVIWHWGVVTVRIAAATRGIFSFQDGAVSTRYITWQQAGDTTIQQIAQSIVPYTKCSTPVVTGTPGN